MNETIRSLLLSCLNKKSPPSPCSSPPCCSEKQITPPCQEADIAPLLDCIAESNANLFDLMAMGRLSVAPTVKPFACAILNVKSGHCGENCAFCSQSSHHKADIQSYPFLGFDEIFSRVEKMTNRGLTYLGLVTSGGSLPEKEFAVLLRLAEEVTRRFDIKLCASIGLLNTSGAARMKQAGFTSLHHNLETSPSYFDSICTTHTLAERIETVKAAREAGLRVCSGGIFGLGESWAQRAELASLLATLPVDSIPINFLIPIKGTPLGDRPLISPADALKTIILFRYLHPDKDIIICGGREHILKDLRHLCFSAGANAIMTGDYLTSQGSAIQSDMTAMRETGLLP